MVGKKINQQRQIGYVECGIWRWIEKTSLESGENVRENTDTEE